jgi:quinol monooxygenase YgiN
LTSSQGNCKRWARVAAGARPSGPHRAAKEESTTINVRAEFRVPSRNREAYVEVAKALAESASDEAGTLRYDWYRSEDPAVFVVIEEYTDSDAALAHNEAVLRRHDRPRDQPEAYSSWRFHHT